ncbi:MAG: lipid asymmetry maintenance protein MlaB [Halioglobus sp.]
MAAKKEQAPKSGKKRASKIALDASMEISNATKLLGRLKKCAAREADVDVNAENVEVVDTAGLQLLLSFRRAVEGNGRELRWRSPSEALLKAAAQTGLVDELGLPQSAC